MLLEEALAEIRANPKPYYVYVLDRHDGTPFYVGKGNEARIRVHERLQAPDNSLTHPKLSVIRRHLNEGLPIGYRLMGFYDTAGEAFELEKFLIAWYGRADLGLGPLTNLDNGGRGVVGHGPETRLKMRLAKLGKKQSPEHIEKCAAARRGKKRPEYVRLLVNTANTGLIRGDGARENMRKAKIGKKLSEEHRAAIRAGHKHRWVSPKKSENINCEIIQLYNGGLSQRLIGEKLGITPPAVNRRIKMLRDKGLISGRASKHSLDKYAQDRSSANGD
jgi:DNA-binding CsgD family transcriptional regulator